jgi:hypothetical protein
MSDDVIFTLAIAIIAIGTHPNQVLDWVRNFQVMLGTGFLGSMPIPIPIPPTTIRKTNLKDMFSKATGFNSWALAKRLSTKSRLWGPYFWRALHFVSCYYRTGVTRASRNLLEMLPCVLPCRPCRVHVRTNLRQTKKLLYSIETRTQYMNYVVALHNVVSSQVAVNSPERVPLMYPLIPTQTRLCRSEAIKLVSNHGRSSRALYRGEASPTTTTTATKKAATVVNCSSPVEERESRRLFTLQPDL